jgi:nucleotide-binding universal stress UspA family protein
VFLVDCFQEYEQSADLVMLGKRGENANFASGHLGSTMERVVRASRQPCFVTSRSYQQIERVLLAYDGSKSCRKALEFIAASPVFHGLELHVVIVAVRENEETALATLREAETTPRRRRPEAELPDAAWRARGRDRRLCGCARDQLPDHGGVRP